jgi:hypothetical protein
MAYRLDSGSFAVSLLTLGLVLPACGTDDGGRANSSGIATLGGEGSTSNNNGDTTADGGDSNDGNDDNDDSDSNDDGSTSSSGGVKFDIGDETGNSGDGDIPSGECQKVDLLFVIDNSGSMAGEQASLIASFDGFVAGIQATLDSADDYHIGVVTTDAYSNNAPGCTGIGALVTQTGGESSSGTNCMPFSSGARYIDQTEPDLASKFSCIAQVGISGSGSEKQATAGYTAISPALNAPGACNDGFIRDDALLVVVIISDEDDKNEECIPFFGCLPAGGSAGNPSDWAALFTQYKGGIQQNIVMLALVGGANNSCGADNSTRLIALTNWFINGSVGDICAPSYASFFNDAISVIDDACDNFVPPG